MPGKTVRDIDVAIVGIGTAALAAAAEVRKTTSNFILISNGVYGTTCVRAGCMPSKALIEAAHLYHKRLHMPACGITGAQHLRLGRAEVMEYVRQLRAHFLEHTLKLTGRLRDHIVEGRVWFHSCNDIEVGNQLYRAKRVVLATGSSPIIPPECAGLEDLLITSDTLFEQEALPERLAVMGLSVLGTEMAQAFAYLGITVVAADEATLLGGLTDPTVSAIAAEALGKEFRLQLRAKAEPVREGEKLRFADQTVDKVFVAMHREANVDDMGLENCGVIRPGTPVMTFNPATMQVGDLPFFVAGDVKLGRSLLHESRDEGRIAGYNAARGDITRFPRRVPMQITYTAPTIAVVGTPWEELPKDSVAGEARFEDQGRALLMGENSGILRIYVSTDDERILGAEMFAPEGEHLAHLIAWLIGRATTVEEALALPFYHPTLEEAVRTALEDAQQQLR